MKLTDLKEQTGSPDWRKVVGADDPINKRLYQIEKEKGRERRHKVDEFWLRIKPEHGGGYFKVRAKKTENKGMLYNYGYFDMRTIDDPNIDPNILTDEGQEDYRRLKNFIREHHYQSTPEGKDVADERHKKRKDLGHKTDFDKLQTHATIHTPENDNKKILTKAK